MKKTILVCTKKDIAHPLSWALKEFEGRVAVKFFDSTKQLGMVIGDMEDNCIVILDSIMDNESTVEFAKEIKTERPSLKILLIVASGTTKEEIVSLVQSKVVNGVLLRPFTAEQVSDYIYKLCGFQKPTDVPWYMKSTIKV